MRVAIEEATLTNVWKEQFTQRTTGEVIEYWRAMVNKSGEPPMQLSVAREDAERLTACIGQVGICIVDLDARPGEKVRVYLKGIEK